MDESHSYMNRTKSTGSTYVASAGIIQSIPPLEEGFQKFSNSELSVRGLGFSLLADRPLPERPLPVGEILSRGFQSLMP